MKKTREQLNAEMMKAFEKRLDEALDWQEGRATFRLTELEDYLLGVGEEVQVELAEGMLGVFLSAAQEYPTVQFRTLEIGRDSDLRAALGDALDRGYTVVEMAHRDGRVFTSEGRVVPVVFRDPSGKVMQKATTNGVFEK